MGARLVLSQEIARHGIEEVLVPDFPGYIAGEKFNVQAVLERTAVVYKLGRVEDKHVVKLSLINVYARDLRWVPRPEAEVTALKSRKVGRDRALEQRRANKALSLGTVRAALKFETVKR